MDLSLIVRVGWLAARQIFDSDLLDSLGLGRDEPWQLSSIISLSDMEPSLLYVEFIQFPQWTGRFLEISCKLFRVFDMKSREKI